mgnify:CR=1 FL=1
MEKKIIIFGYDKKTTKFYDYIKNKKKFIFTFKKKININKNLDEFDLIVLYGYREIVNNFFIKKYYNKLVNLHISYLPYNRGAHPNYWSWVNKTPHGITIHRVTSKVDAGDILFQKKINIQIKNMTFKKSYKLLRLEMDKFFSQKLLKIINNDFKLKKQKKIKKSLHKKKDLPKTIKKNWNISIKEYLNKLI